MAVQPNGLKDGPLWLVGVKVLRLQAGERQSYHSDNTIHQYDSATDTLDRARFEALGADAVREVTRRGDDLTLDLGSEGQLTVFGYFDTAARRVDLFEFADGASWDVQAIKACTLTYGSHQADTLYGYNGAGNRILGLAGDDRLHGTGGAAQPNQDGPAPVVVANGRRCPSFGHDHGAHACPHSRP